MHCILFFFFFEGSLLQTNNGKVISIYTKTESYSMTKVRDSAMLYIVNTVELT